MGPDIQLCLPAPGVVSPAQFLGLSVTLWESRNMLRNVAANVGFTSLEERVHEGKSAYSPQSHNVALKSSSLPLLKAKLL